MKSFIFDILGLEDISKTDNSDKLDGVVNLLIEMRKKARNDKDWALSDQIRDSLKEVGVQLKDSKEGTTYSLD
jgi:cysteinyl-tRNA synthetase